MSCKLAEYERNDFEIFFGKKYIMDIPWYTKKHKTCDDAKVFITRLEYFIENRLAIEEATIAPCYYNMSNHLVKRDRSSIELLNDIKKFIESEKREIS